MKKLLTSRLLPIILCAAFLLVLALSYFGVTSPYMETVLIYIGINIILAVSLNLVNGYMGEFSVGHAGFMAIGAYTAAVLTVRVFPYQAGPWLFPLALLAGGAAAGLAGLVLAIPSFRTRGDYLAIVTLAFNMIIKSVLENIDALGGARGFMGIAKLTSPAWTFVWVVATIWLARNFIHSRFGRGVLSIREDETAAALVGVNTRQVKVLTFVFSALLAGIAGGLFAHTLLFINPRSFSILKSTDMLVMIYLGGTGSLGGAILGGSIFTLLQEGLRQLLSSLSEWNIAHISQEWRQVMAPLLLVLLMLFRPRGIMGGREFRFLIPWSERLSIQKRAPLPTEKEVE